MSRPDISNRTLGTLVAGLAVVILIYAVGRAFLPDALKTPGSPVLYLCGVFGALLLLVSAVFVLVKRAGRGGSPPFWFNAHIIASCLGTVLVVIHSAGYLRRPPALLFLALLGLIVLGVWARIWLSRRVSSTFGEKYGHFGPLPPGQRERLRAVIDQKLDLLRRLDPQAQEGTFSLTLAHWLRHPMLAADYAKLARAERDIIGTRRMVPPQQAYWRAAHLALGYLFVIGLIIHVITVTFFAGYVADGGDITWWHLTQW